jgi:hypothetical protein
MGSVALIVNVSNQEQIHSNGLSGQYIVPGKEKDEFGMLVVYPRNDIQDQGDGRSKVQVIEALELANSVLGVGTHYGSKEKWGLILCEAQPDIPKELLTAVRAERDFLNDNPPDVKSRIDKKSGAVGLVTVEPADVSEQKRKMSEAVQRLRSAFEKECRRLVTKKEIAKGKANLLIEDQKLVSVGDKIWAGPEPGRVNISEIHQNACIRLGQERPWCYVPQQLVDCPGCGAKIKENVLSCQHCTGWLDEGIEELRAMPPKDRAMKMYPERYAEPMGATGKRA